MDYVGLNILMATLFIVLGVCFTFLGIGIYERYQDHLLNKERLDRLLKDYPYLKGRVSRLEDQLDHGNEEDGKESIN